MKNKYAIIIAIEKYHNENDFGKVHYALNDANGIKSTLEKLGYKKNNIEYLTNNHATRTTTFETIKKISNHAQKGESILFYYAGHGLNSEGRNLISCVDSSLSSVHETCISLQDILEIFNRSKSTQIMLFLDCCHSGLKFDIPLRSPISTFSTDGLKNEYSNSAFLTGFAACLGEENSKPDSENKHGAWSYFLIKALSGEAKNIYKNGLLFSDELQKYLKEETFNRVRLITTDKKNQTPIQFGKNTDKFIIADVSEILSQKFIKEASSPIPLKKITLLTEEEGSVTGLPGFIKGRHKAPKEISKYYENWIKNIAQNLLEEEINKVGQNLQQTLRLKRKQILSTSVMEGIGEIVTSEFDYTIAIKQSADNAHTYVLMRSLENFKNSEIINSKKFNQVFDKYFDKIELNTEQKIDIESLIDKIENIDDENAIHVSYEFSNTSKCTITIPLISQILTVSKNSVLIKSQKKQSPLQLINEFKECYKKLSSNSIGYLLE